MRARRRAVVQRLEVAALEARQLLSGASGGMGAELLVRFADHAPARAASVALCDVGAATSRVDSGGATVVRLATDVDRTAALARLKAEPDVVYAEPNGTVRIATIPNDPEFPNQWGLNQPNDVDIDAPQAWDVTTGVASTLVAVVDTGMDDTHADLAGNVWTNPGEIPGDGIDNDGDGYVDDVHGWDFANNDNNPSDDNAHGTHVSGIIGAKGNNGVGVDGVNWNAKILPVKALDSGGSGTWEGVASAIRYAADRGAKVINASLGGWDYSQTLYDAIAYAGSKGAVFVAAAGNNGTDNDTAGFYPANFDLPNVVSVAAVNAAGGLAWFSNYGATKVDLGAPGDTIESTIPGNSYGYLSGTSMATPYVTGVFSLVAGQHPEYTPRQMIDRVLATVKPLASLAGRTVTGGMVDAYRAVANSNTPTPTPTPIPTPPATPTNVSASALSASRIGVSWSDVVNEDGYRLQRSTDGRTWTTVATLAANQASYTDTGLAASTTYSYRVQAFNAAGSSAYSAVASARTLDAAPPPTSDLPAPGNMDAASYWTTKTIISWSDIAGEDGYYVERSRDGQAGWSVVATLVADQAAYRDTGLAAGTTYFYRVRGFKATGVGPYGAVVSATTLRS